MTRSHFKLHGFDPDWVKLIGLCLADEQLGGQLLLENILIYILSRFCYEKHLASVIIR